MAAGAADVRLLNRRALAEVYDFRPLWISSCTDFYQLTAPGWIITATRQSLGVAQVLNANRMPLTVTGSVKKLVLQSDLCLTSHNSWIKLRLAETICIVSHVINSLQCRRILGGRKLLVYVRIIVTAGHLLFYDGGRLGRVKIVLRPSVVISSSLLEIQHGGFASKTFARPKKTPALQAMS